MTILTGGANYEAPAEHCADWPVTKNSGFQRHDLGQDVGHYTFLEFPSDTVLIGKGDIFTDHETVDRHKIHLDAAEIVLQALG